MCVCVCVCVCVFTDTCMDNDCKGISNATWGDCVISTAFLTV